MKPTTTRVGPAGLPVRMAAGKRGGRSLRPVLLAAGWIEGLGGLAAAMMVAVSGGGAGWAAGIAAASAGGALVFFGLAEALRRLEELGERK